MTGFLSSRSLTSASAFAEHLSSLDREQPGRELELVLPNYADHGDLPLQELPHEFVEGEVFVARDVVTVQSLRYIEHYP